MNDRLTTQESWDQYWSDVGLPLEVKRGQNRADDAILDVMERYTDFAGKSVVEIGGAPGQYLAYFTRRHGVQAHVLDYSRVGCARTEENFRLLGFSLEVHNVDLFADSRLPPFDVVFSLGLIEHFADLKGVVRQHVKLLKPGGTLVIGCPNFRGVNGWVLDQLAPALMAEHNLGTMDARAWNSFEAELGLTRLFRGYVGGFEPALFLRRERKNLRTLALNTLSRALVRATRSPRLNDFNSPLFSQYLLGVYRRG